MVPCALGQGKILRPLSTKTTEFGVKNMFKNFGRSKIRTFTVVILLFLEGNKTRIALEMILTKL